MNLPWGWMGGRFMWMIGYSENWSVNLPRRNRWNAGLSIGFLLYSGEDGLDGGGIRRTNPLQDS